MLSATPTSKQAMAHTDIEDTIATATGTVASLQFSLALVGLKFAQVGDTPVQRT